MSEAVSDPEEGFLPENPPGTLKFLQGAGDLAHRQTGLVGDHFPVVDEDASRPSLVTDSERDEHPAGMSREPAEVRIVDERGVHTPVDAPAHGRTRAQYQQCVNW